MQLTVSTCVIVLLGLAFFLAFMLPFCDLIMASCRKKTRGGPGATLSAGDVGWAIAADALVISPAVAVCALGSGSAVLIAALFVVLGFLAGTACGIASDRRIR